MSSSTAPERPYSSASRYASSIGQGRPEGGRPESSMREFAASCALVSAEFMAAVREPASGQPLSGPRSESAAASVCSERQLRTSASACWRSASREAARSRRSCAETSRHAALDSGRGETSADVPLGGEASPCRRDAVGSEGTRACIPAGCSAPPRGSPPIRDRVGSPPDTARWAANALAMVALACALSAMRLLPLPGSSSLIVAIIT
mmetsp:Transcript_10610/g.25137  ORF Transcript_10610/g.25137 Transcript_10610/m.25137 type:complete len:207 (+) Transcript_10610:566-1186(+)